MESLENEAIKVAAKQAVEYMNQITKSPIGQLGEIFGDNVRIWRYKRAIKHLLDVKAYHKKVGIQVKQIPLKVLLPLLENASLEEDENLQEKWTALLANAIDFENNLELHNIFVELLRQLSPVEVKVLDYMFDEGTTNKNKRVPKVFSSLILKQMKGDGNPLHIREVFKIDDLSDEDEEEVKEREKEKIIINNLVRLNLIEYGESRRKSSSSREMLTPTFTMIPYVDKSKISLTTLGEKFIKECRFKK